MKRIAIYVGFGLLALLLFGLSLVSLGGAVTGKGSGFLPLAIFSILAFIGAITWLIGGFFGADRTAKEREGFAIKAELGPLYAEVRPQGFISFFAIFVQVFLSMFSIDRWGEVFDTIKRNKLRTVLTCISVAWGIFVMVVLLGLGQGLNNGIRKSFRREAANGIYISASKTSMPYAGYGVGRKLTFNNRDYEAAKDVDGIEHLGAQYFIRGGRFGGGEMKVQKGTKSNMFGVNAVNPAAFFLSTSDMAQGRFLNDLDVRTLRKAAVIGEPVRDFLFGHADNNGHGDGAVDNPIGEWVVVGGVPFEIVGVFHDDNEENARQLYIPVSTAQLSFNGADRLGMLMFTVGQADAEQAGVIKRKVIAQLAASHQFSPDDKQAVRVFDNVEGFAKFQSFFNVISLFVLVIGLGTLAAGVVGVSNIMMIAVKERTKEIGVRKALGATPQSIVAMIVQEAVFLTSIAGLLGLSAGVVFLGLLPSLIETELIDNPSINIAVGILAAVGLMVAGALAGFVPARSAAKVNPIETLRDQ